MSLIFSQIWVGCNSWYWLLLWAGFIAYMVISMSEHWTGNFISDFIKKAYVLDRGSFVVNRLSNLYLMKEAIVHTTTGGFAAIATAFVAESLQNMIPWLIVSCAVILCDLLFGVRKSILMGEKVRFSRAIRATMGKMVTYFAFVCMVCMISVASHNEYPIDVYSCLLVCFIEGCSIVGNILKPKGININLIGALGVFGKKVFKVDKEDVKDIIEKEEIHESNK